MSDLDDILGTSPDTQEAPVYDQHTGASIAPAATPKPKPRKVLEPEIATREQLLACLAFRIATEMGNMDRLTYAAHRDRLEKALAPCRINPDDLDELRTEARDGKLDKAHAKLLRPFDDWIIPHDKQTEMVLLMQIAPDYVRWDKRFPDAAVATVSSPMQLITCELPKAVTKLVCVHNLHNTPDLARAWLEAIRFSGIDVKMLSLDNIKKDEPKPTATQVRNAKDTLRKAEAYAGTKH